MNFAQCFRRLAADEVRAFHRRRPVALNAVFYESFNGNGAVCNPEAIFRYLLASPEHSAFRHIWSLASTDGNEQIRREFARDPRVTFVAPGTAGYFRARDTSRYLISNATFDRQFSKRPGQIYLNTWHGTPLKKMGFDIGDHASRVANVMRNFLHADYLVSPNEHTTTTLYGSAHRLDGLYEGALLESGYPRIDRQAQDPATLAYTRAALVARGLDLGGRRIVLWAPTWRGRSFTTPEDDADEQLRQVHELQSLLDAERFVLLLKTHQSVHHRAAHRPDARAVLVPNDLPTNLVLGVTDALVTDYSSIFFDFLALDRPIVFFAPDIAEYENYRGLYLETAVWPGPVVSTVDEVAGRLRAAIDAPLPDTHAAMRRTMSPHDDGQATRRIVAAVFGTEPVRHSAGNRTRLLFALPAAAGPARIAAAIDTMNRLHLDDLDVSVMLSDSRRGDYLEAQERLDSRIRRFVRQGRMETDAGQHLARRIARRWHRLDAHSRSHPLRRMWEREWRRLVGGARFDVVVDLVGSEPFWATLLLHSAAPRMVMVEPSVVAPSKSDAMAALALDFDDRISLEALDDFDW